MQNPVDARWTLPLWLQSLTTMGKRSEGTRAVIADQHQSRRPIGQSKNDDTALRWRSVSLPGRRRRARAAEPHSPPRRLSAYTEYDPMQAVTQRVCTETRKPIRIGIVGANAKASWAALSHVPAINGIPGLKLAAVATRNAQSAREAAEIFGADHWFSDPLAMIRDDQIDLVTIAVNVPTHRELVLAALDASKAVYCEAPLGRTVEETEEMASAAGSLHTAIGLQGRLNPAVRHAAHLLSSGKIGRPLKVRIVSNVVGFGPEMPSAYDYFNKVSSGANLLTITVGHTLDVVEAVLGPIIEVEARTEILWPTVKLTDTGENSLRETADHASILGSTHSGVVFAASISGGIAPEGVRFSLEIRGSEGWLRLTSDHPYGVQAGDIKLASNVPFAIPHEGVVSGGFMGAAINVGEVYAHLARDIHTGDYDTPGFEHALHNARLIEAVLRAAEHGERQILTN
jgi:predicted dehydrogenase